MKGTYFLGADRETKFEVREMKPGPLGSEEVLVKNYSCGICGTDVQDRKSTRLNSSHS